jgi:hypothetical protein
MIPKEIITEVVDKETGEITEVSNFVNGKLYGMYSVISNKTVRENEKFLVRWFNKNKKVPGAVMARTNRGYFIDGYNVDEKSITLWFNLTGLDRNWRSKPKKQWKKKTTKK